MLAQPAFSRTTQGALRRTLRPSQCRRYAAVAAAPHASVASSSNPGFEAGEVAQMKVVSRDLHRPTTTVALVAKAGTRYEPAPGMTTGLVEYAFKSTLNRSALRIQRESELLGSRLKAYHNREAVVIEASFLRADLPYFIELLADVVSSTRFTTHEFREEIAPILPIKQAKYSANVSAQASDAAHLAAFHMGLGNPLFLPTASPISHIYEHEAAAFALGAYPKSNMSLVADGASQDSLKMWTEKFFSDVPVSPKESILVSRPSKYYGGEQRVVSAHGNSIVIAFEADPSKPEFDVLAALLGGKSTISRTPGFSLLGKSCKNVQAIATNLKYSDAGLFTIELTAARPAAVAAAAGAAVDALKSITSGVSQEDLTKAISKVKFDTFELSQTSQAVASVGMNALSGKSVNAETVSNVFGAVSSDKVKSAAKALLQSKASVGVVGDLYKLPFASDLGLSI